MFEGVRAKSQTFLTIKVSSSTMLVRTVNYCFILMVMVKIALSDE
jgi:hypothetical protein